MQNLRKFFVLLTTITFINCKPNCVYLSDKHMTTCSAGASDYVLKRGLVSDNNDTISISLRQCRLTGIELSSFNGLFNLKHLDLSDNMIQTLRLGSLDGAKEVTHLNLSYNQINELPIGLLNSKTKLELLDLKGNNLMGFNLGIFDPLSRLGHLDLSSNNFQGSDFSPFLFDKSPMITFMDFSGSVMIGTPDNLLKAFRRIAFLNLSGCSLTSIPKFALAANLRTMYHLMLINNLITEINDPETFDNLPNLQMLNFAGNSIEIINKDVFRKLRKLRSVVLAGNRLKSVPGELFKDLENLNEVDLSGNMIEFVDVNAFRGSPLRNLNLSNNKFTYLMDNFLLELSNSRASLRKFSFNGNPWQCACLIEILKEAKKKLVDYNSYIYDGKSIVCVTADDFHCKRQPNYNELYVEKFNNLVK